MHQSTFTSLGLLCLSFILTMFNIGNVFGQGMSLTGKFIDQADQSPLIGLNILLISQADSLQKTGTVTDVDGNFRFNSLAKGAYLLRATYIGYKTYEQKVLIREENKHLGTLAVEQEVELLKEVRIQGNQIRAVQKGDTTQYNASAYKTNPDASAEDLITKMPGIEVQGGSVRAQGEDVRRVMVDGQEFFGEDATLALRNLPAEIIDQIQVFDRMSDQSRLTGFNDGNTEKTINIVTKPGMNKGQFGKLHAGYGTDERYTAGGNVNYFNGQRRISLIGLSNNINQQNFSSQDLLGVVSPAGQSNRGGGGQRGGGRRGAGGSSGGDASNFLVGQQSGISHTNSVGLNYSEKFGSKLNITGSYFFNNSRNFSNSQVRRETFLSEGNSQFYAEDNQSNSNNMNHRLNMRIEYNLDSANTFILTPSINLQDNYTGRLLSGLTSLSANSPLTSTQNKTNADNQGLNIGNNLLFRHKFKTDRRSLSLNLNTQYNDRGGENNLYSINNFYNADSAAIIDQQTQTVSRGYTVASNLSYTEPLGKSGILQLNYSPSLSQSNSQRLNNLLDVETKQYSVVDSLLSNQFDNTVSTQRAGLSYRLRKQKLNFMSGVNYQYVLLASEQTFPRNLQVNKAFNNVLPSAMLQYEFSKKSNLRLFYRTATTAPTVNQLQNVVNNTNPLLMTAGNPDLKQEYTHSFVSRYNFTGTEKARTFFAYFTTNYTNNYIGNATFIASSDTTLPEGVLLFQGAQLNRPVNLKGNWSIRSFMTYGMPVQYLKSNLNLNAGISYNRTPGLINQAVNLSNTINLNSGLVLSSNISEKLDFTFSYAANYNIVRNSIQPQLNNNYYNHNSAFRLTWMPWKGLVVNSDLTNIAFNGLGSGFNQHIVLWNAGIGYKFMKNNAAELRLNAFDLLGQNKSISRNVTETYVEDNITQVLTRYLMLTFTYNVRNFKATVGK